MPDEFELKGEIVGEHPSPAPGRYPVDLECEITTRTNERLRLRPIRPSDDEKLTAFHRRLSADSIYRRYFSLHPELSLNELVHLTQVDYVDRLALVVEDDERLLAVCRYERYPRTREAEVAFLVADDHQHEGIGTLMLHHLADAARARGIETFLAETLATNHDMMSVFLGSGYPVTTRSEDQEIVVRLSIASVGSTSELHETRATSASEPC